jgi:L-rhamnose mutarotase
MERVCFEVRVRADRLDEYRERHRAVWPEMLAALREAGIRNYTIFRDRNEVFGYFESDDADAAAAYMEAQEVNARWQDTMAKLLEDRVPDAGPPTLEEIFRLE